GAGPWSAADGVRAVEVIALYGAHAGRRVIEQVREQIEVMDGVSMRHTNVGAWALESGEPAGGEPSTTQAASHERSPDGRGDRMETKDVSDLEHPPSCLRHRGQSATVGG